MALEVEGLAAWSSALELRLCFLCRLMEVVSIFVVIFFRSNSTLLILWSDEWECGFISDFFSLLDSVISGSNRARLVCSIAWIAAAKQGLMFCISTLTYIILFSSQEAFWSKYQGKLFQVLQGLHYPSGCTVLMLERYSLLRAHF